MSRIPLHRFSFLCLLVLGLCLPGPAQTIDDLNDLWHQTLTALKNGQQDKAETLFGKFNQTLRHYLQQNPPDWQVEFLAGSLECQFPQSRKTGAEILKSVLQTSRDLNEKGKAQLTLWLNSCTAAQPSSANMPEAPAADIIDTAAHFQAPGLHSFGKGGYMDKSEHLSGVAVSPIPPGDLLRRRVPITEPQKALSAALQLVPGAVGTVVGDFVVATDKSNGAPRAEGIGKCLSFYQGPLRQQFEIEPPDYMVSVYVAQWTDQVYDNARRLHGLQLPPGVVAYSVLEDMSLSGLAYGNACGSLAHELVHLLIKRKFPMSPAWLEEGLASEVAVSVPHSERFSLSWSWRDASLRDNANYRPTVAALLETSWADFNATGREDIKRAAALQAMAAVFIRYLDARGKLDQTYFAVRDQHLSADLSQSRTYREIVEDKLHKSIADIDADFSAWFAQQVNIQEAHGEPVRPCSSPVQGPCPELNKAKAD
jgi:hypothetical protein